MAYNSKNTGAEIQALLNSIPGKQEAISDLDTIRQGASKGATALQSVPDEYITETELSSKGYATASDLEAKVDKVSGKGLTTEDFTTALKTKLEGLNNYNDTEISNAVSSLQTQLNTLVNDNANDAINSFNEIIAFLDGVKDTQDLAGIIASIEQQIANKMDKITLAKVATSGSYNDLSNKPVIPSEVTESTVNNWGFTKNTGTITSIKMNGATKGSSGVVDLGVVLTEHQDISNKQDVISDLATIRSGAEKGASAVQPSSLATVATSGSYNDLSNKPMIPSIDGLATVSQLENKVDKISGKGLSTNDYTTTEKNKLSGIASGAEVNVQSDWSVTDTSSDAYIKNKPTIPSAVTESTVSEWGFTKNTGTYSKPSGGIPKSDLTSDVQASLGKADTALQSHQDISGKQDKLVSGTNIKTINNTSILGSGNISITGNSGTITGVSANGTSIATSGVANIPSASTSVYGVTKLTSSTSSTSTTLAATASAVKSAYDLANSYKGTVTSVKLNGTTYSHTSGIIDLGTISGGSSNANVQAVETGDTIDDVTVNYATTSYVNGLIGDINSVLESIINGGGPSVTLITFTIDNQEYQAEEGMTFGQWMLSKYYSLGTFSNDTNIINALENDPTQSHSLFSPGGMLYTPNIYTNTVILQNEFYLIDFSGFD